MDEEHLQGLLQGADPREDARETDEIVQSVKDRLFAGAPRSERRLGRFTILRTLNRGGMGVIHVAKDPVLDRDVAVKVVKPDAKDVEADRIRLHREARALAMVIHPNVVTIHDVGQLADGQVFLVMELIDGENLDAWLRRAPRPWEEVLDVFLRAGYGLAAAHAQGVVHRDFKPANVMLSADGKVVKLIDFGLSRLDPAEHDAVEGGEAGAPGGPSDRYGTRGYTSPEQWRRGSTPDPRSDQYSFCVSLFTGLFGRAPFVPTTPPSRTPRAAAPPTRSPADATRSDRGDPPRSTSANHRRWSAEELSGVYAPPARGERGIPRSIVRALERGLKTAPEGRFPSMNALLAALTPRSWPQRFALWLLSGSLAAALAGTWWYTTRRCTDVADPIESEWRGSKAAIARALGDGEAVKELDDYQREWASARVETCEAEGRAEAPAISNARVACLDRAHTAFSAALRRLEASGAPAALSPAALLPALEDCSRRSVMALQCHQPPTSAEELAATREVHDLLDDARGHQLAGDFSAAIDRARQAAARAEASPRVALQAEANLVLGELLYRAGEPTSATTALLAARGAAETASCTDLEVDAHSRLNKIAALHGTIPAAVAEDRSSIQRRRAASLPDDLRRQAEARSDWGLVLLHLLRRPEEAESEFRGALELLRERDTSRASPREEKLIALAGADVLLNLGTALARQGARVEALKVLQEAKARRARVVGLQHPEAHKDHLSLGNRHYEAGSAEGLRAARDEYTLGLAKAERLQGPRSDAAASLHEALARVDDREHRYDDALAHLRAAESIYADHEGEASEHRLVAMQSIGQLLVDRGSPTEALPILESARALAGPSGDARLRARLHETLADALVQSESPARGLEEARTALSLYASVDAREDAAFASCVLGEAVAALSRANDASATPSTVAEGDAALARAIDAWERRGDSPEMLAHARWARAQLLCASDADAAKRLASAAREALAPFDAADTIAAIDDWLRNDC
ncbi:MAG: serine/threonine-protein kinase [Nannocystaceae bacterium]